MFLGVLVSAAAVKMEVSTLGKDSFQSGSNITLKVSLFDDQNNPINSEVRLTFENEAKTMQIQKIVSANKLISVNLGNNITGGYWTITSQYLESQAKTGFVIETNEAVKFEINGDVLTITNIGNTKYEKKVNVIISDTVGYKEPSLDLGESVSFRLIAPPGSYNIKVTDGKTTINRAGVALTGEVIGILDERISDRIPITGIGPEDLNKGSPGFIQNNKFIYISILAIVGATVLLGIERHYRKKAKASQ